MNAPLKILLLEDSVTDAELIEYELRRLETSFTLCRVDTRETFEASVRNNLPDLILADYKLPTYDGLTALTLVRETAPDIPFLFVTGAMGEEWAVETLKKGANDYILKDRLYKLPASIHRAMEEVRAKRARIRAETELRESEARYRSLTEAAGDAIICIQPPDFIYIWNRKAEEMFGFTSEEATGQSIHRLIVPETYRARAFEGVKAFLRTGEGPVIGRTLELVGRRKDGREFPVELSVSAMRVDGAWHATGIIRDITDRKTAETQLRQEMEITKNLLAISEATVNATEGDRLIRQAVECIHRITKSDICAAYLWDEGSETFRPGHQTGLSRDLSALFKVEPLSPTLPFLRKALAENLAGTVSGVSLRDSLFFISDSEAESGTLVVIPLGGKKQPMGVILDFHRIAPLFTERDRQLWRGISNQVSVALEEARHYKEALDKTMELSRKIETIRTMHQIDQKILSRLDTLEILETVARMITQVIPCEATFLALVDRERGGIVYEAGFGITSISKETLIPFEATSATDTVIQAGRMEYLPNLQGIENPLPMEEMILREGFNACIRVPLVVRGEVTALLACCSRRISPLTPDDLSTLEKLAAQVCVALENTRLIRDLEELFLGTVKALSEAIDAKSRWTRGHAERVTRIAVAIAKELGFDPPEIRTLEIAGLLHDIGKLGTYEAILDKPEPLNEEEEREIRKHVEKGVEILSSIRHLREVLPAVRHHHEHYDGSGYPDGLRGEAIPLSARILAVADSVDAMGADRPYRQGKPVEEIVAEVKRCAGIHFDPRVAEAFLRVLPSFPPGRSTPPPAESPGSSPPSRPPGMNG